MSVAQIFMLFCVGVVLFVAMFNSANHLLKICNIIFDNYCLVESCDCVVLSRHS